MKAPKIVLLAGVLAALAVAFSSGWRDLYQDRALGKVYDSWWPHISLVSGSQDWSVNRRTEGLKECPCANVVQGGTMVALVFGQSNAANNVDAKDGPSENVFVYHEGRCYEAVDPLPGASSSLGSVWSRLGKKLTEKGMYDRVVFVDIARNGSSILNWAKRGDLNPRLMATLAELKNGGLPLTHILFHQGEADCVYGLSGPDYKLAIDALIRQLRGVVDSSCAIYISKASRYKNFKCEDIQDKDCYTTCPDIVEAQSQTADQAGHVFPGPDTDVLVPYNLRYDGYHFSAAGADIVAEKWVDLLAGPPGTGGQ